MMQYKADAEKALARAAWGGSPLFDIVTHPDDIGIDPLTLLVVFNGPWTKEEKAQWDQARQMLAENNEPVKNIHIQIQEGEYHNGSGLRNLKFIEKFNILLNISYLADQTRRQSGFDLVAWQKRQLGPRG